MLFLLCICLLSASLSAQEREKLDSLLTLAKAIPDDTIKVKAYCQLCLSYSLSYKNDELARRYADSIKILSEKLKFPWGIAESHFYYGGLDRYQSNYKTALQHFQKYLQFHEQHGDSLQVARGLYQMGVVYKNQGELDKSLAIYFRALKILEKSDNQKTLAAILNSIGNIYRQTDRQEDALAFYEQANERFRAIGLKKDYAMGLQNMGNAFGTLKNYDAAKQKYHKALSILEKLDKDAETAMVLANLGDLYYKQGQHYQALKFNIRALAIRKTLPHKKSTANSLKNIGSIYLELKKYTDAEKYLNQALLLAKEINSNDLFQDIYGDLAKLSKAQNDFKKAYKYYEISVKMKDSIFSEERTELLAEMQTKYETEKKDQQITLLAQEKEVQQKEAQRQATLKNAFIVGLLLIALLAGLLYYTLRQRLKNQKVLASKNEEIKEVNFKRQLTELEMKALQAQINPHFIFNCMNSINQMILDGDNKNASKYLTKFGKLIRMVLENAESTEVSLKDELTLLEAYIQLESLRFNGEIQHNIDIKGDIDIENTYLPSMVLQPFVENAIWHGLMHRKDIGNGQIRISIEQEGEQLVCEIEDNGVGRQKSFELQQRSVYKTKSLGLKITEERLKLLSKELQRQLIHITDLTNQAGEALGTRVTVNIPIS